jgi:uncharacterized protein
MASLRSLLWSRRTRILLITILIAPILLYVYAFKVEPYWLEVSHYHIAASLSRPIKLAHLTDIHTSGFGRREQKMIALLASESPDLIVITGDSVSTSADYAGLREVLEKLQAPLGVWLVRGNHEDWWPIDDERNFYQSCGSKFLLNENARILEDCWLVGFDDQYGGTPAADRSFLGVPEGVYKIALFHSPMFIEKIAGRCDLALAGHTHGGQVRLPFWGALWVPPFSGQYISGWFERQGTRMYVNRGIGTSVLDVRILSRPEIAIITIGDDGSSALSRDIELNPSNSR